MPPGHPPKLRRFYGDPPAQNQVRPERHDTVDGELIEYPETDLKDDPPAPVKSSKKKKDPPPPPLTALEDIPF